MSPERRVRIAAENLNHVFPRAGSLQYLEAGASQAFPSDELAGGSAFCYFGPGQQSQYLETMCTPDWAYPEGSDNFRVFFAGEHASYTHGWIHGAMEAGLRCVLQAHAAATSRPS
jgi:monoamine oxidase